MSFWEKVTNKLTNWKVVAGTLTGVAVAYLVYKGITAEEVAEVALSPQERFRRDVQSLKQRINLQQLGTEDLKEIFEFLMLETQRTLSEHNLTHKQERRTLKDIDFKSYLKCLVEGFVKMQELTLRVSEQVMSHLGIPEQRFQMACSQHPEITNFVPNLENLGVYRELELSELREAITFQKVYVENHGQELIDKIKAETADWDMSSKRMLPIIVGMIIGDELFSQLGLEDEQIEQARMKYQAEVRAELQSAQAVLTPFMRQLEGGNPFASMGFDPSMMGGMDPSMMGNIDAAGLENFMEMMGMDPSMLQGMDPSMFGMDPNAMAGMMGGLGGVAPHVIDPTLMQQVGDFSDDPEAVKHRMSNLMMHN